MTEQRLRVAMWITLPILLFCGVYSVLQARRAQQETAVLRVEVEALHKAVTRQSGAAAGAAMRSVPSPRPTPAGERRAKTKAVDRASKAKGAKSKGAKTKGKATAESVDGIDDLDGVDELAPRAKGAPRKGKKAKGRKGKAKSKTP